MNRSSLRPPPPAWIDAARVEPIATSIEIRMDAIGQVMHVATVPEAITALSALHHVSNHRDLVVVARTVQRHILAQAPPPLDLLGWALYYELHGLHGLGDHAGCYQRYHDDESAGARRAEMPPANQAWCASVAAEGAAARGDRTSKPRSRSIATTTVAAYAGEWIKRETRERRERDRAQARHSPVEVCAWRRQRITSPRSRARWTNYRPWSPRSTRRCSRRWATTAGCGPGRWRCRTPRSGPAATCGW